MRTVIRKTVYYSGYVQGVGFRYTACRVAARYAVTGYVRNLRDGRVEMTVEGDPAEVNGCIDGVADAMAGCVRDVETHDAPASGEFREFTVRY